jgi:hypothetical protein
MRLSQSTDGACTFYCYYINEKSALMLRSSALHSCILSRYGTEREVVESILYEVCIVQCLQAWWGSTKPRPECYQSFYAVSALVHIHFKIAQQDSLDQTVERKCHLLLNNKLHFLPLFLSNEPDTVCEKCFIVSLI